MKTAVRVIILGLFLTFGLVSISAQSGELLTNPGFEPPFLPQSGEVPSDVATGWMTWYVPAAEGMSASDNVLPEYFAASDVVNGLSLTPRIHGGEDAQQYFSYYATHTGGLYQQVSGVTAGAELTFSVYAFLWASDASETSDGSGELLFSVGIDPNGGTDGTSASIVWSEPASGYDAYSQYSVSAAAAGDTVTVFIRSTATAKIANNVVYVDDASLTAQGGEVVPTAEVTAEIPPTVEATTEVVPTAVLPPTVEAPTEVPPTVEATTEVTAEPTVEATVEAPTEVAPTAEVTAEIPPTVEAPTEVAPTAEVTTEVPPTVEAPTTVAPTVTVVAPTQTLVTTPLPSPTLDGTRYPQSFVYTVQPGDTVVNLALRYGSSIDAIIIANGLNSSALIRAGQSLVIPVGTLPNVTPNTPAPTLPPTATLGAPTAQPPMTSQPVTYVIQFGDTLSGIASRFGTTTRELARLNGITNPNLIYYGQLLIISTGVSVTPVPTSAATRVPTLVPTPITGQSYRVMPGDNLYTISLRFGVPLYRLIEANNLTNPNRIYIGQVLIIPNP